MYLSPFINLELKLVNSISLAYQLKIWWFLKSSFSDSDAVSSWSAAGAAFELRRHRPPGLLYPVLLSSSPWLSPVMGKSHAATRSWISEVCASTCDLTFDCADPCGCEQDPPLLGFEVSKSAGRFYDGQYICSWFVQTGVVVYVKGCGGIGEGLTRGPTHVLPCAFSPWEVHRPQLAHTFAVYFRAIRHVPRHTQTEWIPSSSLVFILPRRQGRGRHSPFPADIQAVKTLFVAFSMGTSPWRPSLGFF